MAVNAELDMVVSASKSGRLHIHTMQGKFVRAVVPTRPAGEEEGEVAPACSVELVRVTHVGVIVAFSVWRRPGSKH